MPENRSPANENDHTKQGRPSIPETIQTPTKSDHSRAESSPHPIREWVRFAMEVVALLGLVCYVRAAQQQVEVTRDTLSESYKPILELTKYPSLPTFQQLPQGLQATWHLAYTNDGRGIARGPTTEIGLSITEPDEADWVVQPTDKFLASPGLPIKPTAGVEMDFSTFPETRDPMFVQRFNNWKSGRGWLNIQLIFHYLDESGQPHGSSICESFRGSDHGQTACRAKDSNGVW